MSHHTDYLDGGHSAFSDMPSIRDAPSCNHSAMSLNSIQNFTGFSLTSPPYLPQQQHHQQQQQQQQQQQFQQRSNIWPTSVPAPTFWSTLNQPVGSNIASSTMRSFPSMPGMSHGTSQFNNSDMRTMGQPYVMPALATISRPMNPPSGSHQHISTTISAQIPMYSSSLFTPGPLPLPPPQLRPLNLWSAPPITTTPMPPNQGPMASQQVAMPPRTSTQHSDIPPLPVPLPTLSTASFTTTTGVALSSHNQPPFSELTYEVYNSTYTLPEMTNTTSFSRERRSDDAETISERQPEPVQPAQTAQPVQPPRQNHTVSFSSTPSTGHVQQLHIQFQSNHRGHSFIETLAQAPAAIRPRSSQREHRQRSEVSGNNPSIVTPRRMSPRRDRHLETLHLPRRHRRGHLSMHAVRRSNHDIVRTMQILRGTLTKRTVTSKSYIQSLDPVPLESLGPGEETCNICYSDYSEDRPEGEPERPLRIPKCGHVFGHSCLNEWLGSSNTCPYCRVELPLKILYSSTNRRLAALLAKVGPVNPNRTQYIERFEWLNQDTLINLLRLDGPDSNSTVSDEDDDSLHPHRYREFFRAIQNSDHRYAQGDFDAGSEDMYAPVTGIPRSVASPQFPETTSFSPSGRDTSTTTTRPEPDQHEVIV